MKRILLNVFNAGLALFFIGNAFAGDVGLLIRFGLKDKAVTDWSGSLSVEPGRVALLSGWHFQKQDKVIDGVTWKASTHPVQQRARSNNPNKNAQANRKLPVKMTANGVLATLADVAEDSVVTVKTAQGEFFFPVSEIPFGGALTRLEGAVEVTRTAATLPLSAQQTDDDFPAAATGRDGTVYAAYVSFTPGLDRDTRSRNFEKEPEDFSYLAKPAGGDQVWLHVLRDGKWEERVAVTPGGGDIYKVAVTVDNKNRAWVIWSERQRDAAPGSADGGEFDVFARSFQDGTFSEIEKVSSGGGNDINPVAVADGNGRVWVAWQGAEEDCFRIMGRNRAPDGTWSKTIPLSPEGGNCWSPAIASDGEGNVAVAWDTYDSGDYDVWFRQMSAARSGAAKPVANTADYEARPALTYDKDGNLWIAWEESGPSWGKDWGAYDKETAIPLYSSRTIGMRVLSDGEWKEPAASWVAAMPGRQVWDERAAQSDGAAGMTTRAPGSHAEITGEVTLNNIARLATDGTGGIWLIVRSKMGSFRSPIGSVWMNFASYLEGDKWVGPILLSHSDNLLYNLPAATAAPGGGLLVAHSSDHRQTKTPLWEANKVGENQLAQSLLESTTDPFVNDVYVSLLDPDAESGTVAALKPATVLPADSKEPSELAAKERADVARIRDYRTSLNGTELRILRGEFHRHTEISGDGGNDGPLEDMWRYAIDVAAFDWIGNGDHDNGGHREYPWWLTQKTTDAYHIPGVFDPLFTYERSVKYPEGHRNVVFVQRGVRTLPRLPISSELRMAPAPDTQMLYRYLHHFGGICASHTSATNMGTDWRDNDPVVEPFVEIYQGARQNYERPEAPRCPTEDDAIGGWRPKGFVNLALKMGYRLAFQSSSDHRSTHISYCNVYAKEASRQGIFDGMKTRHVYGATDNIIADYRCVADGREYMMGDEFTTSEPPTLDIRLHGTAPFERIVIIKDDVEIHTVTSKGARVYIKWTDPEPESGKTSYYYVRGEQSDEELVWVSPMWIKYEP